MIGIKIKLMSILELLLPKQQEVIIQKPVVKIKTTVYPDNWNDLSEKEKFNLRYEEALNRLKNNLKQLN